MFKKLWFWLKPYLMARATDIASQLADIAVDVVRGMAESDAPGDDKREQAAAEIKSRLKAIGLEAADHLINAAIEAAVANIKAEK